MLRKHSPLIEVQSLAKCNKCGDEEVAWVKSKRTGKPYLATAYKAGDHFVVNTIDPHFKRCGVAQ